MSTIPYARPPAGSTRYFAGAIVALFAALFAASASACPDWRQNGMQLNYTSDTLWTPRSHNVVAGGGNNLSNCPMPGVGYVTTAPDFTLNYSGNMGRDLEFRVQADCDTVLLVNDASANWHFNDDQDGPNPRIRLSGARDGIYDIWVGTYGPSTCSATLTLETFGGGSVTPPAPPPSASCPDWQIPGQQLTYGAEALWQPRSFSVTAGGSVNLANCGSVPGVGHVAQRPDFTLNFNENNAGRDLEFRVQGACDTVLLVNDAQGQWHYVDDADGSTNPRLRLGRASVGQYDIWVGTYGSSTCSATLVAETFGGGVTPPPPPGNVLPDPGNVMGYRNQVGQTLVFQVTGAAVGSVWGSEIYTDDSSVARAAVHAGLLQVGQSGVVRVTILPGQQSYQGSMRNGVQTTDYGAWSGSFRFVDQGSGLPPPGGGMTVLAGTWGMVANGHPTSLQLNWTGNGWNGTAFGETLLNIAFDPVSGRVEFLRPGPAQHYVGYLRNGQLSGEFNQGVGSAYSYRWSATR